MNNMTEEIVKVKRVVCDVCGFKATVETTAGVFSKPKTPPNWGTDLKNVDQLCPSCTNSYKEGYLDWYSKFKEERKK